jgi:hypothetical protein
MNKKILCICKNCNRQFYVVPSRIKNGRGKCCCRICKDIYQKGKPNLKNKGIKRVMPQAIKDKLSLSHRKEIKWELNEKGCHICKSHKPSTGGWHPMIFRTINGIVTRQRISRFVYEQKYGTIQRGLSVRHTCDNPLCINVEHLILGSNLDNIKDKVARNRQTKGTDVNTAKLTETQVIEIINSKEKTCDLMKRYGVSKTTICLIRKRKIWKHLTNKNN